MWLLGGDIWFITGSQGSAACHLLFPIMSKWISLLLLHTPFNNTGAEYSAAKNTRHQVDVPILFSSNRVKLTGDNWGPRLKTHNIRPLNKTMIFWLLRVVIEKFHLKFKTGVGLTPVSSYIRTKHQCCLLLDCTVFYSCKLDQLNIFSK